MNIFEGCDIVLKHPYEDRSIHGEIKIGSDGFFRYRRAFGAYDAAALACKPHEAQTAWDFAKQLYDRAKCGIFHVTESTLHPTFLEPMLRRFGDNISPANERVIEAANALAAEVDNNITKFLLPSSIFVPFPPRNPEWGKYDMVDIRARLGDAFAEFDLEAEGDGKHSAWLFSAVTLARSSALMRSHPTFDSIRSDITLFDDGMRTSDETSDGGTSTGPVDAISKQSVTYVPKKWEVDNSLFVSEIIGDDGEPLLFIEKETGMFYVSSMAAKFDKDSHAIMNTKGIKKFIDEVKLLFNLTQEQAMEKRLSPHGTNNGYYCHFLVALRFAASVSCSLEVKMYAILARYFMGDVTTTESRAAARFMARSLGVVSRDPAAIAAPETVEIAGFKRRLAMEVHDQAASKDAVIAEKVKELKSSERSNDILRDRVSEKDEENAALKAEMAQDKPYYRAWKRLYDEKRDLVDKIEEHEVTIRKYEAKFGALE